MGTRGVRTAWLTGAAWLTGTAWLAAVAVPAALLTGCDPGGAPGGVPASSVSRASADVSASATPSWAKALGSGVTVTPPGAAAPGSPAAVLSSAIADIKARRYVKICDYLEPARQAHCKSQFASAQAPAIAAEMPTLKNLVVTYTAVDGTRALVGLTGTICGPQQKPACVTNDDPAAIFDSGKAFSLLWTEAVSAVATAYSLTPMIEINGHWYGFSSGL